MNENEKTGELLVDPAKLLVPMVDSITDPHLIRLHKLEARGERLVKPMGYGMNRRARRWLDKNVRTKKAAIKVVGVISNGS